MHCAFATLQEPLEIEPRTRRGLRRIVRRLLESRGWLVVRTRGRGEAFDLVAFPRRHARWPRSLRDRQACWVGVRIGKEERPGEFEAHELRDLARGYGGRACFARFVPAAPETFARRIRLDP